MVPISSMALGRNKHILREFICHVHPQSQGRGPTPRADRLCLANFSSNYKNIVSHLPNDVNRSNV